ncbi:hypothetical protein NQ317_012097 [Molorchus minor]|uniref:Uncharacterized protein n=1 Tax=Molorchus minor TaxID=1323400 RepID=A0ABQ9J6P0_9CUCU|nr:hypothetical protein NQ317_012097 [Molorchus minor]
MFAAHGIDHKARHQFAALEAPPLLAQEVFTPSEKSPYGSPNHGDKENYALLDIRILVVNELGLDKEVLKCLGEDPNDDEGEKIELHKALVPRVPSNSSGLETPIFNPEIAQAVSPLSLKKDKYQVALQTHLGAGITTLGKALNMTLVDESSLAKSLVPILSDTGKLLMDLFHLFSVQRSSFLTPQLNPLAMNIAKS